MLNLSHPAPGPEPDQDTILDEEPIEDPLDEPLDEPVEYDELPIIGGPAEDRNGTRPILPAIRANGKPGTAAPASSPAPIRAVSRSETGPVRDHNEDACLALVVEAGGTLPVPTFGLLVVGDGMGGHHDGSNASRQAVRMVAAQVLDHIYRPLLLGQDGSQQAPIQDVLVDAVQAANYRIHNPRPEREGGTTLTAVLILGRRLFVAHVGDSRAYLLADDRLTQLTNDHSFVQRLQETGQLSPLEAASHPQRNVLYRAVGQGPNLEVDTSTRQLPAAGQLLVCSDGLWGLVSDEFIQETMGCEELTLAERNDRLVEAAIAAGGYDNVTAVLGSFAW